MSNISNEEKEMIIEEAVKRAHERILLSIPEVIGNLIATHTAQLEINKKFYSDNPEFKKHKKAVMSVVEKIESEFPGLEHEDILKKAVPEIKKRIKQIKNLDMEKVNEKPNRNFTEIEPAKVNISHGDL